MTTEELKTYASKRAYRQRQLNGWNKMLLEWQHKSLKDVDLEKLQKMNNDLETIRSHMEEINEEAYQTFQNEPGLLAKEEESQVLFEQEMLPVTELAHKMLRLKKTYAAHTKLQMEGRELMKLGPTAPLAARRYDTYSGKCRELLTDDEAFTEHTQIAAAHAATEGLLEQVRLHLFPPKDDDKGDKTDKTLKLDEATTHHLYGPKLSLDILEFDGQPRAWHKFREMFEVVLDTRCKHMSDMEKRLLLEKSLITRDAKDVVIRNYSGDKPFERAMKALEVKFGNPRVLLPLFVRDLTHNDEHYAYTREGLQSLYDKYVLTYEHIHDLIKDSLTVYLCQCAREHFNPKLREEWDKYASTLDALPTVHDLGKFVDKLVNQMEPAVSTAMSKSIKPSYAAPAGNGSSPMKCPFCKGPHPPQKCPAFSAKDVTQRYQMVRDARLCLNCLKPGHSSRQCANKMRCKTCGKNHHTMVHLQKETTATPTPTATSMKVSAQPTVLTTPTLSFIDTVVVNASNGPYQMRARAALDSGAGISLISEQLATQLKLPRHQQRIAYEGIRGKGVSKAYVNVRLTSLRDDQKHVDISLSVIPKLNPVHRPRDVPGILQHQALKDLTLSDPDLGGHIDLLLGNLDRHMCITGTSMQLQDVRITLTPTLFGWSVAGPLDGSSPTVLQTIASPDTLYQALARQWELEAIPAPPDEHEEDPVIRHFQDTHSRDADGRYIIKLPRIKSPPALGKSRLRAMKRYLSNERSLTDKGTYEKFLEVLQEYVTLGHAEIVPRPICEDATYYLPVHGVVKADSTTTKLRAVFDASAPTSNGKSLNDLLEAGPNLYPALPDILMRFRSHRIALTADVGKMFREVILHPSERDLHRFLMRNADGRLMDCRMRRLTFGVKSSPFVATQVLRHLASEHVTTHPNAARVITEDFYVDDCLTGVDTIDEGKRLQEHLCTILQSAGMTLRKWRTNSYALLHSIPDELRETTGLSITTSHDIPKALGVHWDVKIDVLHVSTPVDISQAVVTKRVVASVTAQVFDVLGLMAPAIIPAKILLQGLWRTSLKWDDPLPEDVMKKWEAWTNELPEVTSCSIPRRMTPSDSTVLFKSLHGFADASSVAYGAAVYLRTVHDDGNVHVALVTAKARVLPLKPITIPRAELVATSLLTKLMTHVARVLKIAQHDLFAWTDSAIVLHWMHKPASSLKIFVRNRISHIQENLPATHWRHVSTSDNPADLLSRGCPASELRNNTLWWEGPPWLLLEPTRWKTKTIVKVPLPVPEMRTQEADVMKVTLATPDESPWSKMSSFTAAIRILAWTRRFVHNCRKPAHERTMNTYLLPDEIQKARGHLILLAQHESFPELFDAISSKKNLPVGHFLSRTIIHPPGDLPYVTVSGRIRDKMNHKMPRRLIPLRARTPLTSLLLRSSHTSHGHPGTEALLATLCNTYFIQGARNTLKKISRQCVTCQKTYAHPMQPSMGLLPTVRTTPAPPFTHVGMDFAGPFISRRGHTRKPVYEDCYVCLFVCMATRAIHLDICADLSTTEFLATLRRFMARRGVPTKVYSDNGTNFVGASNAVRKFLSSTSTQQAISHLCSTYEIRWKFIPPRAPHMGGLWEAGVKSMKSLLKKTLQPHPLRHDEFYTILTEVEASLNSRPLSPLHGEAHPDDMVLTPGHFLVQRPLKAPPLHDELTPPSCSSHLRRWSLVQQLNQTLWDKWLQSYLQSRFTRSKWLRGTPTVKTGDIVLIKDVTLKRRTWPLGKITKTFPGDDGVTRTVEVLCNGKCYNRAVHLLCPILHDEAPEEPNSESPEAVEVHEATDEDDEHREPAKTNMNILTVLTYDDEDPQLTSPDDEEDPQLTSPDDDEDPHLTYPMKNDLPFHDNDDDDAELAELHLPTDVTESHSCPSTWRRHVTPAKSPPSPGSLFGTQETWSLHEQASRLLNSPNDVFGTREDEV